VETPFVSDRRLYLDARGRVVEEGNPAKVELLVGPGGSIPHARAVKLGLIGGTQSPAPAAPSEDAVRVSELEERIAEIAREEAQKETERATLQKNYDEAATALQTERATSGKLAVDLEKANAEIRRLAGENKTLKDAAKAAKAIPASAENRAVDGPPETK
jgi:septal ring factor EnvC (AmiA/AmiB activator)